MPGQLLVDPDLENRFTYHPPKDGQPERYERMREGAKRLAYQIRNNTPQCREQAQALNKLDEVVFWANAAIARREK